MKDFEKFVKTHKGPVIVIGVVLVGFVLYSFVHKPKATTKAAAVKKEQVKTIVRVRTAPAPRPHRPPKAHTTSNSGLTTDKQSEAFANVS